MPRQLKLRLYYLYCTQAFAGSQPYKRLRPVLVDKRREAVDGTPSVALKDGRGVSSMNTMISTARIGVQRTVGYLHNKSKEYTALTHTIQCHSDRCSLYHTGLDTAGSLPGQAKTSSLLTQGTNHPHARL
jgi:hypothetical protein